MCQFLKENQCSILHNNCPWSYFCTKENKWKFKMQGQSCKVAENVEHPKGYYKVCFEKHGNLYISVNGYIEIVKNPYNFVPVYIKMFKLKNGNWKIKDAK